jgi:hypothetical protein
MAKKTKSIRPPQSKGTKAARSSGAKANAGKGKLAQRALVAASRSIAAANVDQQVIAIIQTWSGSQSVPKTTDSLGTLAPNGVPFDIAANNLAGQLDDQLGAQIQGSDLTKSTTVDDVINDVLS